VTNGLMLGMPVAVAPTSEFWMTDDCTFTRQSLSSHSCARSHGGTDNLSAENAAETMYDTDKRAVIF